MKGSMIETPEQMLMRTLELLRQYGEPPDEMKAREIAEWEPDVEELQQNPHMKEIHFAEFDDYILFVSVPKKSTLARMPPGTPKMSWSIHTMPENVAIGAGTAGTVEQGKRFAEIAYRAVYGVEYRGDA